MKTQVPNVENAQLQSALSRTIIDSTLDDARPKHAELQRFQDLASNSLRAEQLETVQAMMVASSRANDNCLPPSLKGAIENLSGISMNHVKVHYNSNRPAQLQAHAYTQGSDIHVAPGQEHCLPHEAWHVVQQAQGRVAPTIQGIGNVAINDDQGLEHEADVMGQKALANSTVSKAAAANHALSTAKVSNQPVQLKSVFNSVTPNKKGADTPLKTLHDNFGPLMTAAGLASQYSFHSALTNIAHNDSRYSGADWDKAGSVDATLDSASRANADGKNRDNKVIGPYGHFGVMERAILGRPNRGNTYDGGHLVEHTLMEGQDADKHGNLAPQENKNFNQGLMRGWESIPENYMDGYGGKWRYKVDVIYTDDSYDRTGAELIAAGVIPKLAEINLAGLLTPRDSELTGKTVTFERWVPYAWKASLNRTSGTDLPSLSLTHGTHMHNLMGSHTSARDEVFSISLVPPLIRTYSGTLSGFFSDYGMVAGSSTTGLVGGNGVPLLNAYMYQPVPQPFAFQPYATTTPSGKVPVLLPSTSQTVNLLSANVSMSTLKTELQTISLKSANSGKIATGTTIVGRAKKASSQYVHLHGLLNNNIQRATFIRAVHFCSSPLDKTMWPNVVKDLPVFYRKKFESLVLDPRLQP